MNTTKRSNNIENSEISIDSAILKSAEDLAREGFAVHWLHPNSKRPVGEAWSEAPVATADQLRRAHQSGFNVGVRLGDVSKVAGGYLHVIDMDIRFADLADEAWETFARLFPGVNVADLPCVQSGSGGESRHLYLITDKPFDSRKLATSQDKYRRKTKDGKEVWSYTWEIELFGTGKQVAMPPSIHPDTGKPYIWLREFDFVVLDLGIGPFVDSALIADIATATNETYEFELREPLIFTGDQLDRVLTDIPEDRIDDRVDWVTLGMALHHQFGGSDEGFKLWMKHSARGSKFLAGSSERAELRRYRGFGRNRKKPVTMASVVEWAKDARIAKFRDAFDEEDEDETGGATDGNDNSSASDRSTVHPAPSPSSIDPFDLIGQVSDVAVDAATNAAADAIDLDDILGGDDEEAEEEDSIDAIGANRPVKGQSRAVSGDWIGLLDINDEGAIKPTLHNVELIVRNDPRLVGLPQLNEFTQEVVQRQAPGSKANRRRNAAKQTRQLEGRVWSVKDILNGDLWSDDRDFAIRSILEAPSTQGGYGVKITDRDLKAAVTLAASGSAFHPVREYLDGLAWDREPRVERLFIDYLGAPDDPYTRNVARLMMVGAVTRVFEPGHKFDFAVILEGLQGKRKSTFIRTLGRNWFGELDADWHDAKQLVELMQGAWIMELPELSGFGKADVRTIKAFVSRQSDRVRLAYARRAGEFPRQCIFIGSTNDREYLKDDTGGRRWWPIECAVDKIDTERLERQIDQMWGEAVALYREMRLRQPGGTLPLFLTDAAAEAEALRLQETRRAESPDDVLAGQIGAWLDRAVHSGDIANDDGERRNETCCAEIWSECLGKDTASLSQANSQMIGRALRRIGDWEYNGRIGIHGRHGKQRIWERGGLSGRLARAA